MYNYYTKNEKKSILYNSSSNELLYETECISVIFTEFFVALPCIPSHTNDYHQQRTDHNCSDRYFMSLGSSCKLTP